jgi:hypothetical protein
MPGMKVTVPASGWTVYEDHPGEFNLASPGGKMAGTNIHFWLDPYASTPHDRPIRTAGRTPAALIRWLRGNTPDAQTFSAVIPTAEKIIDSVQLPATVSAG